MTANTIYIAIFLATCATYLCRAMGVFSAKNINTNSPVFNWIKCVSIGIISAVISKIILFPAGILSETESESRIVATIVTLLAYFLFKKNVIFGIFAGVTTLIINELLFLDMQIPGLLIENHSTNDRLYDVKIENKYLDKIKDQFDVFDLLDIEYKPFLRFHITDIFNKIFDSKIQNFVKETIQDRQRGAFNNN